MEVICAIQNNIDLTPFFHFDFKYLYKKFELVENCCQFLSMSYYFPYIDK